MTDRIALDDMTSDQLDQLYDRLKFTEDALARMRDRLEVTVVRVRNLAGRIRQGAPWTANDDDIAAHILAALDGDQAPAATLNSAAVNASRVEPDPPVAS